MNIFVLDNDPKISARFMCNQHCGKLLIESAQMLCSAHAPGTAPYRRTHYNHPCSKWTRASIDNYSWLCEHALELSLEFERRYGKVHKTESTVIWCCENVPDLPRAGLTPFALAMPDEFKSADPVASYRTYYLNVKSKFAKWHPRAAPPAWWPDKSA